MVNSGRYWIIPVLLFQICIGVLIPIKHCGWIRWTYFYSQDECAIQVLTNFEILKRFDQTFLTCIGRIILSIVMLVGILDDRNEWYFQTISNCSPRFEHLKVTAHSLFKLIFFFLCPNPSNCSYFIIVVRAIKKDDSPFPIQHGAYLIFDLILNVAHILTWGECFQRSFIDRFIHNRHIFDEESWTTQTLIFCHFLCLNLLHVGSSTWCLLFDKVYLFYLIFINGSFDMIDDR